MSNGITLEQTEAVISLVGGHLQIQDFKYNQNHFLCRESSRYVHETVRLDNIDKVNTIKVLNCI